MKEIRLGSPVPFDETIETSGFRLKKIEIYNWGTFHNKIWCLPLDGENTLLTGDIGSGKSTLVDAITTLLVPPTKISFNKAAGAEYKERSLRSYVLGYYKSEKQDNHHAAKPVALRDHRSYAVLLAVFENRFTRQSVTIAQVFWQKDITGQPDRFYVVADKTLSISADFTRFGHEMKQLRKKLRNQDQCHLFEAFPPYAAAFMRRFGIENDQALDLFHQTVSMKSVGNLTDFVREHMLETFDIRSRIDAMIHHFDDLTQAHNAVLKAKRQVGLLQPMIEDFDSYHQNVAQHILHRQARESLEYYFSQIKLSLLTTQKEAFELDHKKTHHKLNHEMENLQALSTKRDQLKHEIAMKGGDRLERIALEKKQAIDIKMKRQQKWDSFISLCKEVSLSKPKDEDAFYANQVEIKSRLHELNETESNLQNDLTEQSVSLQQSKQSHELIETEIDSLAKRQSNIPLRQVQLRHQICQALDLDDHVMPFCGELLQIHPDAKQFEGAIERVLHQFALSLLVPEQHYEAVAKWVNDHHLNARLVYYKIPANIQSNDITCHAQSLANKINIKPNTPFKTWLRNQLCQRFDYQCCHTLSEFHQSKRAITDRGQIKSPGFRIEKDDRHAINDRSRYVLGWQNKEKLKALKIQQKSVQSEVNNLVETIVKLQATLREIQAKRTVLVKIEYYQDYEELDWQAYARIATQLEQEYEQLKAASNQWAFLATQLDIVDKDIANQQQKCDTLKDKSSRLQEKLSHNQIQCRNCQDISKPDEFDYDNTIYPFVMAFINKHFSDLDVKLETCDKQQQQVRHKLQANIDRISDRVRNLESRIIKCMDEFCRQYPMDAHEVDPTLQSEQEFRNIYQQLKRDDIPSYEAKFKALLNENTIREIANLQSQLYKEKELIKSRIGIINESLLDIDFNTDRYIKLIAQDSQDKEIKQFQQDLRACTSGSLAADDAFYSEEKFLQVKAIIERFKGREGLSELDKRWTKKVTDVRYWFMFAASECLRETGDEFEHYTDSSGKSGGQKEKLAYTVLAASLAYQFGLDTNRSNTRSFRFVVIDEAFGRGSDDSAEYGLRLFKKLGLQLLVVTPLQKIHVIEPYISHVGFVHNTEGKESVLRHLTIEAYQNERDKQTTD